MIFEAITYSNAIAIILAATSFLLTLIGLVIAAMGVRSAAKANEEAKRLEYMAEMRRESFVLLKMVSGGKEAYITKTDGSWVPNEQLQILAAALLKDHPQQLGAIIAIRDRAAEFGPEWQSIVDQMNLSIKAIKNPSLSDNSRPRCRGRAG